MPTRTCETCATKFEAKKKKPFCSKECNPKRHKKCLTCFTPFLDTSSTNGSKRCSKECNPNARKSRDKVCNYCDTSFKDNSKQNSMSFCSTDCRRKEKVTRRATKLGKDVPKFLDETTLECVACSENFTPTSANQLYCDTACRDLQYHLEKYADVPDHLHTTIACKECDEIFTGCIPHGGRSGNHFEDVHQMSTSEYQAKYPDAGIYCEASVWKQTQKRWTATPEQKNTISKGLTEFYKTNHVWNFGMNKSTHTSVMKISDAAKIRHHQPSDNAFHGKTHSTAVLEALSSTMKDLKKDSVYVQNWMASKELAAKLGAHMSKPHAVLIQAMRDAGLWDKYGFEYEKWLTLDGNPHGIDIASKTPFKYAIEVDGCRYHGCPEHGNYDKLPENQQLEVDAQKIKDRQQALAFRDDGWIMLRLWEHELKADLPGCLLQIATTLGESVEYASTYKEVLSHLDKELPALLASVYKGDLNAMTNDEVLHYYRIKGFPFPLSSSGEIKKDFCQLTSYRTSEMETEEGVFERKRLGLGMKGPQYFMRNFWTACAKGKRSCMELFKDDEGLVRLIQNRRDHAKGGKITDSTLRTGLRLKASAPASFPATMAKHVYTKMGLEAGDHLLDPCAGFGGRMIGAFSLGLQYTGVDPWSENLENLEKMRQWYEYDQADLHHTPFETSSFLPESFDGVFTSPPHWNKETYVQESTQSLAMYPGYEDWMQSFMKVLIEKAHRGLKSGKLLVLHLSHFKNVNFVDDCERLMTEAGFEVQSRWRWKQRNFFRGKDAPKRYEPFLVGKKL